MYPCSITQKLQPNQAAGPPLVLRSDPGGCRTDAHVLTLLLRLKLLLLRDFEPMHRHQRNDPDDVAPQNLWKQEVRIGYVDRVEPPRCFSEASLALLSSVRSAAAESL